MPDVQSIPRIAQMPGVSNDALYGDEEQNPSVKLAHKLCCMSKDEAYRYAFELCWAIRVGLLGEPSAVDLFVNRGFTESDKANGHFAKLIHDSGMTVWINALAEGKAVSAESLKAMTTEYSSGEGYGYGMYTGIEGGVGHYGSIGSYSAFDYINTDKDFTLFVTSKTIYPLDMTGLADDLLTDLMK